MMKKLVYLLLFSSFAIQLHSQGIKSSVSGFSAEIDVVYGEWQTNSFFLGNLAELEPVGGGLKFKVAYGFLERAEVFAAYTIVNYNVSEEWDRFINNNLKFGARFYFGATLRRFRPYLEVAIDNNKFLMDPIYIDVEGPYELDMAGLGFSPAGGVNYFIIPSLAVNLNLGFSFGNFNKVDISGQRNTFDENLDYTFFNVNLGMSYFFQ